MKTKILLLFFLILSIHSFSQFGPQQIISSTTNKANKSIPLDIDNDSYIDVLTTGSEPFELYWHRNLDGSGNFGPKILIPNSPAFYLLIEFVDLDGDGDKDLIYLENNPRIVAWLENVDGLGNFSTAQIILEEQADFITYFRSEDIDNDNDVDLIVNYSNTFEESVVWFENLDGLANFGEALPLLNDTLTTFYPPLFVDIDNDGNRDMLTSYKFMGGPGKLVWYRNLGIVSFDNEQEIFHFSYFLSDSTSISGIQYVDINTDGKMDIVIVSHNADIGTFYHWFENLDNLGNFGPIQPLPISGIFCDIDNDGDNDILTGNRFVNRIYWVENTDGLGVFTIEHTITTEVDFIKDIQQADINEDGKLDVISASLADDKVAWYENLGTIGVTDNILMAFSIHPNPTTGILNIQSEQTLMKIEVYDSLGQLVTIETDNSEIDINKLNQGIYFLKIFEKNGVVRNKRIIKK